MVTARGTCRSCHAAVLWVETASGKKMPVNAEPDPTGNMAVYEAPDDGRLIGEYVRRGQPAPGIIHKPHHATCPDAAKFRRR